MNDSNKQIPIRNSIKILLINPEKQLLLMCAEDPKTRSKDGSYYGRFWFPVGGQIEASETALQAATRELFEETGLQEHEVTFGPIVWFGEFEMILSGTLTRLKQQFIVAHTHQKSTSLQYLTEAEKCVIKQSRWFSLNEIRTHDEVIYPVVLKDYVSDILHEKYPQQPIEIDLAKKPI